MSTRQLRKPSLFLFALLTLTLWSSQAFADAPIRQAGNFGIGLGGGTGTSGLSLKYFLADGHALQGTVGFNFRSDYIGLGLDYLLEIPEFLQSDLLNIGPAIGLGGGLGVADSYLGAAVSGVAGLEFNFNIIPIDLVLEWRPTLAVLPDIGLGLVNFTGHIRIYF